MQVLRLPAPATKTCLWGPRAPLKNASLRMTACFGV